MNHQYEYRVVAITGGAQPLQETIALYSIEGWRVISIMPVHTRTQANLHYHVTNEEVIMQQVVFERVRQDDTATQADAG